MCVGNFLDVVGEPLHVFEESHYTFLLFGEIIRNHPYISIKVFLLYPNIVVGIDHTIEIRMWNELYSVISGKPGMRL